MVTRRHHEHQGGLDAGGFTMKRKIIDIDEEKCTGCSLCSHVCPVDECITMAGTAVPLKKH